MCGWGQQPQWVEGMQEPPSPRDPDMTRCLLRASGVVGDGPAFREDHKLSTKTQISTLSSGELTCGLLGGINPSIPNFTLLHLLLPHVAVNMLGVPCVAELNLHQPCEMQRSRLADKETDPSASGAGPRPGRWGLSQGSSEDLTPGSFPPLSNLHFQKTQLNTSYYTLFLRTIRNVTCNSMKKNQCS